EQGVAGLGTRGGGEREVMRFQTSATRTPGAMLGLVGVLALFESGLMPASLVVSQQEGHNLSAPGGVERMAEAVARGAACNSDLLLDVDFFQHANEPPRGNPCQIRHPAEESEDSLARSVRRFEINVIQVGSGLIFLPRTWYRVHTKGHPSA